MLESSKPCRPKYFSEKTDSEKIEQLKDELIRSQNTIAELCKLIKAFFNHTHIDNKMYKPLNLSNAGEEDCGCAYFRIDNNLQK